LDGKDLDIVVVGAGAVGLATALAALARFPGAGVEVLEKEDRVAAHQTGRNSGVIHSGVYYKPGSFKARLCVEGAREMLAFCRAHGVPHRVTGKVVVAVTPDEVPRLDELERRARANGVPGLERVGPERLRELEPHARGVSALWVPGTGIVSFTEASRRMADLVERAGGRVSFGARVLTGRREGGRWVLETLAGTVRARFLVTCCGLFGDRVAASCGSRPSLRIVPFRGEYYTLSTEAASLVKSLVYPVPDPSFPFLGVHFTNRVEGGVEAGPNAVWALKREGYRRTDFSLSDTLDALTYPGFLRLVARFWRTGMMESLRSMSKGLFLRSLQRMVPEMRRRDLRPGGSGVRAQALERDGRLTDDFRFEETEGALHVLNAPSPAATACLPIGRHIAERIRL
jgi:L-2-hydroxyglutarate oxidase LhgO